MKAMYLLLIGLAVVLLGCLWTAACAAEPAKPAKKAKKARPKRKANPVLAPIKDIAGLPRVLLIGDSISMGYTLPTRKLLKGKVNLHRVPANGGPTSNGLASLDKWLGKGTWDVIHFNWGLHDLKYMNAQGGLDDNGTQQIPPDQYAKNLRELVARMKKTGAKLIWCSTTPVPEGSHGRIKGDAAKYNAIAAKIMAEAKVPTDDLYAFALPRLAEIQQPKNVHFKPEGYAALAHEVANAVLKALGEKPLPAAKGADK